MGMKGAPERKYLRPDTSVDQRTFDERGNEVGTDNLTHDEVWADVLSLGKTFARNIADTLLGKAMQTRRGEILVTRSENSQDTRAIPYRARKHERPHRELTHDVVGALLPHEHERRSLRSARHGRHSRGHIDGTSEGKMSPSQKLSRGGFQSNLGREYELLARMEERTEAFQKEEAARRKTQLPTDDIPF